MQETTLSPMMQQWHACKQKAPNSVLLFRMGDFYEAFYEDAALLAQELELTLTGRQGIPMSGVPVHTFETYVDRLIAKGHRVAVAEQLEDPRTAKGIVKRDVVRIITPGTVITSTLLSDKNNNYIAAIDRVGAFFGIAFLDLTTSEFRVLECEQEQELLNELMRIRPSECILSSKVKSRHPHLLEEWRKTYDFLISELEDWRFDHQNTYDTLIQHFRVHNLDGFGLKGKVAAINAAGCLIHYLRDQLTLPVDHLKSLETYSVQQCMRIDRSTLRHLELVNSLQDGSRKNTLLEILDQTQTPMGGRLLRHWLTQPLNDVQAIRERHDSVDSLCTHLQIAEGIFQLLNPVRDLERLIMRVSSGYASPRDLVALRLSLEPLPAIKSALQSFNAPLLLTQESNIACHPELVALLTHALVEEPPIRISDGKIFQEGYNAELDELRSISRDSKEWLAHYQARLRETTGLKTLKVGYTKMFGYYIEVSRGQASQMPSSFERRQTLVNAERFITSELKDYESKVLHAEERMTSLETELFNALRREVAKYAAHIHRTAQALAIVDVLLSLARIAKLNDYTRPLVDESDCIEIIGGRHPVIESRCQAEKFIPNDTLLDEAQRLMLITGPNMAGKSTYIRQVALIAIMAHMGSFVPAKSCHLGFVDQVFSRIGASDDLARGQSTFMVEMTETANILNNATNRSLVILDEIGRGTSTYDGISIAWSVAEYLLTTEGRLAKTLFATHYAELTKLEEKVPGALNYHVAVHESDDQIVFLRRILRGGTDKSYGIHVGRLAGLPLPVILRAKEILAHLEENANRKSVFEPSKPKRLPSLKKSTSAHQQLSFLK